MVSNPAAPKATTANVKTHFRVSTRINGPEFSVTNKDPMAATASRNDAFCSLPIRRKAS